MPIYDYECPRCGVVVDVWAKIDEGYKPCKCGDKMKRLLSATRINPDIQPYIDTDMSFEGTPVTSRRHRDQLMKEKGLYAKTNTRWI